MNARDEIIRATGEADRLVRRFPVGERSSFDIVGALRELGYPVLCRPLENLLGATVTVEGEMSGVLVTTKRPLSVQRFTLAHELGHLSLGHRLKFDRSVGEEGPWGTDRRPIQERAADTFASELLAPSALIRATAKRQGWTKTDLREPHHVYQLALRLGLSFKATCWALVSHQLLTRRHAEAMSNARGLLQRIKCELAPPHGPSDSWADVWRLTEGDSGLRLEAGPNDIFVMDLSEHASGGYVWAPAGPQEGLIMEDDQIKLPSNYGSPTERIVHLRYETGGMHRLEWAHRRPWSQEQLGEVTVTIDNWGKEQEGLPRATRAAALAGGVA